MKQSPFQLILLVVAAVAIVGGVLLFAFNRRESSRASELVTIWGTMPSVDFIAVVDNLLERDRKAVNVQYQQFPVETFEKQLVEQLAAGTGPDLILLPQDLIVRHQNKLLPIPYEFYPERSFKDVFIEEGELYLSDTGVLGVPFTVDPLVMYWNRSLFTRAGFSEPPREWSKLLEIIPQLTVKDSTLAVTKAGVALGEFRNIDNAKEIFTALLLQAGNPVIIKIKEEGQEEYKYESILGERLGYATRPAEAALNFYTQFSNPSKAVYSWNRSLPSSAEMFVAGDLAIYFGFASEFDEIRKKNPNLNFDVAVLPESGNGAISTYGKMQAFSIIKTTDNFEAAFNTIVRMTEPQTLAFLSDHLLLPPVRRDLLNGTADNAIMTVFYNSALRSKGIYDLNPEETNKILQDMVESYITGRTRGLEAINEADNLLQDLILD